jgi:hypothetical protein
MVKRKKREVPKKKIQEEVRKLVVRASHKDIKILGLVVSEIPKNTEMSKLQPYVALKYFRSDWQCFSEWTKAELEQFSKFIEKLQNHTWEQVYKTGNKIPKHGLGYTKYKVEKVKSGAIWQTLKSVQEEISEDIDFFELRVNQKKLRVHGFQSQAVFFLVALDRNHEAFPM